MSGPALVRLPQPRLTPVPVGAPLVVIRAASRRLPVVAPPPTRRPLNAGGQELRPFRPAPVLALDDQVQGLASIYVGPEAGAPATVARAKLLILREAGAAADQTAIVVREPDA